MPQSPASPRTPASLKPLSPPLLREGETPHTPPPPPAFPFPPRMRIHAPTDLSEIQKAQTRGPAWERCSRFDRERDHGGRPQEEAGGGPRCGATGLDGKFSGAQGGGCLSREGETVGLQSGPDSGQEDWEATGTEAVHDEGDGRRGSIPSEFHRPCLTHRTGGVLVARIGASRAPRPRQIEAERFA